VRFRSDDDDDGTGDVKTGIVACGDEMTKGSHEGKLVLEALGTDGVSNKGGGTASVLDGIDGRGKEHADINNVRNRSRGRNGFINCYSTISISLPGAISDEGFGQPQHTLAEEIPCRKQRTHLTPGQKAVRTYELDGIGSFWNLLVPAQVKTLDQGYL
jgi:hypothetical protein